jgi:hypothetical protein
MRQGRDEALSRGLAIAAAASIAVLAVYAGARTVRARQKRQRPAFDYSDRSGFPRPPEQMRGIARPQLSRPIMA